MSLQTPPLTPKIERLPAVLARTGLGRSSIYAAIKRLDFPVPVKLSARAIGFLTEEVDAWIATRAAQRLR
jgi:prophage regulatory protein